MKNSIININEYYDRQTTKLVPLPVYKNKIAIAREGGIAIIPVIDILYCQAQSNYCKIVLRTGKEYLISKTLKRVQSVLDPQEFIKVHQSYLVAMDSIIAVAERLTLSNKCDIPVSRSQRKQLMERIGNRCTIV